MIQVRIERTAFIRHVEVRDRFGARLFRVSRDNVRGAAPRLQTGDDEGIQVRYIEERAV